MTSQPTPTRHFGGRTANLRDLWRYPAVVGTEGPDFPWKPVLWMTAIGFLLRLSFHVNFGVLLFPDAVYRYLPVGAAIPDVWLGSLYDTPGYPLLVAAVHHSIGLVPGLLLVQNLLSCLCIGLTFDLGLRLGLGRCAYVAPLLLMVSPTQVVFADIPLSEVLFLTLTTAWAALLVRWRADRGFAYFAAFAAVTAALVLTRANGVLFLAILAGLSFWSALVWRRTLVFALVAAVALTPIGGWVLFNGRTHGFYGIAQGSGWQFLQAVAHHQLLDPATLPAPFDEQYEGQATLYQMRARHFDPMVDRAQLVHYDGFYQKLAWRNVAAKPWDYVRAVAVSMQLPSRETRDMVRAPYNQGYWEHQRKVTDQSQWNAAMKPFAALPALAPYHLLQPFSISWAYPLLILAAAVAAAFCVARRRLWFACLFAVPVVQHLLLSLLLNPIDRYFFPLEPLLLLAAVLLAREAALRFQTLSARSAVTSATDPESHQNLRSPGQTWFAVPTRTSPTPVAAPGAVSALRRLVIVPAYNEAANLVTLVSRLQSLAGWDYIIINDGSSDDSAYVLEQLQVPHLNLPVNLGIGGAMQTGYRYALAHGYDFAIQIDGDGQHDPQQIEALFAEHQRGDCIIGSRFLLRRGYQSSWARLIGIRLISQVLLWAGGSRIHDPTSGMRLVNRRVIRLFAEYYPHDFPEPESTAMLLRAGLRVAEVPVCMAARCEGESSIRGLKTLAYMVQVLPKIVLSSWFRRYV